MLLIGWFGLPPDADAMSRREIKLTTACSSTSFPSRLARFDHSVSGINVNYFHQCVWEVHDLLSDPTNLKQTN